MAQQPSTRAGEAPREWVDPDTGHRIIRLSDEPGSITLYFHQNSFTPEGDKYIFDAPSGTAVIDLTKLGTEPVRPQIIIPDGRAVEMAWRKRDIYFVRDDAQPSGAAAPATAPTTNRLQGRNSNGPLLAANIDTGEVREIPNARGVEINADETFSVMAINAEDPSGANPRPAPRVFKPQMERMFPGKTEADLTPDQVYSARKEDTLSARLVNPTSMAFVFTNLKTGEQKTVGYQWAWLNHHQFNPTDPSLFMYCHEGTWHEIDRIWTIRTDGSQQKLMHKRTLDMEIAGHEFWSYDGKTIWFDLQTPRSETFWIAGINVETGKLTQYPVDRDAWSVHYNVSRDNSLFVGDGGDASQVAYAPDGMWINLFTPGPDGSLQREKLVNMSRHNYVTGRGGVEPNAHITPDKKWVIYTGDMFGGRHVFAVEIAKARTSLSN